MLSLRTHSVLDYVIGAVLVLCPYLFGFSDVDAARNTFLVLGFGLIAYSLLTDYPYSIAKVIPVRVHMWMDVFAGVALILAPSILGYRDAITGGQYLMHWVMGLGAIALVATTRKAATAVSRNIEERPSLRRVA